MRFFVVSVGVLALAGCASRESPVPLNSYQTVTATETAVPALTAPEVYRISPLDQVRIDVFGEPELSFKDLPVGLNGKISLPLAGDIVAEGSTTTELSQRISASLQHYLRRPQVAVNVTQFTSQKVTVEGAVKVPGVFQALNQMTLLDALAMGQGLNDNSKRDEILVFRRKNGQRYVARFDMAAIQDGQAADPIILPGDIVVVGYSASRRLFGDALAGLSLAVGVFALAFK